MRFGSLFAGIGGIDLGLERAGMECAWQVEIDPYCQKVLEKHWLEVKRYEDIKECGSHNLEPVDLVCGGFPCQDISYAGKGAGIRGERSGLWAEFHRIVRELRPRYVLVENVPALLGRGLGTVLGDLAACGYDAEWESLPAAAFGAPHRRDRVFIVAYPSRLGRRGQDGYEEGIPDVAYAASANARSGFRFGKGQESINGELPQLLSNAGCRGRTTEARDYYEDVAHTEGSNAIGVWRNGFAGTVGSQDRERFRAEPADGSRTAVANANSIFGRCNKGRTGQSFEGSNGNWATEPDVGRVAHGVPSRVDRLKCLGNAVVPQVAEWIGKRIIESDKALQED